ncbi:MAG: hypothetical protein V3U31_00290 [Dehalococcoidia bacterium]
MSQKTETPQYITALLQPIPGRSSDRRVWSIPLAGVWQPFFTATNAAGETAVPADALGHPLRLALEKDGTPKFSTSGRPTFRVAKELADQVRIVRDNFVAGLMAYTDTVSKGMAAQYKAQVEAALKAGEPLAQKDADNLADYIAAQSGNADAQSGNGAPEPEKVMAVA